MTDAFVYDAARPATAPGLRPRRVNSWKNEEVIVFFEAHDRLKLISKDQLKGLWSSILSQKNQANG